jgi:hypothetical protein
MAQALHQSGRQQSACCRWKRMKIQFRKNQGSVFLVILVITGLIGVTLASYLHMVSNQNLSIMRSLAWNEAVAVSEAGIEEAMAHLNKNRTNRAKDGWTLVGTNVVKEKVIGTQKYKTYIDALAEYPRIVSEGWVRHPQTAQYMPSPRTVRVSTTNDMIFAKGMVAKGNIDLAGNGIASDSFDSKNPAYNSGGKYDSAKKKAGGDIATNSSVVDSLDVWNAEIYGKVSTGPGGNVKIQNGSVGSLGWVDSGKTGVEPGWSTDDMNVYFPDVDVPGPYSSYPSIPGVWVPGGAMIDGTFKTFDYSVPAGNYTLTGGLDLNNKSLVIKGPTIIYIKSGDFKTSGNNGGITIAPGGSLQLYMGGEKTTIAGSGILNKSGNALNFGYWGLPSNKEVTLQGNGEFIGTIYAPQAALTFGGGGSSGEDFMGAAVGASVKMGGHYKFHYDENLGKFGYVRGYTVVSWNEVPFGQL